MLSEKLQHVRLSAFADASSLTDLVAEIIKFRSSNATVADHFELRNIGGVNREGSLNANTVADLAQRYRFSNTAVLAGNADPFEDLDSLFATLTNLHVSTNRIASNDAWQICFQALLSHTL